MESKAARREILEIRHSSLYAPRDFDISPYFEVVKPTIVRGFDYTKMHWADLQRPPEDPIDDPVEPFEPSDAGEATLVPDIIAAAKPAHRRRKRVAAAV
jgi:hypothetical protein